MNNEEKLFSIKTILGNFVFITEENKSKKIQGLSFSKFVLGGFVREAFVLEPFNMYERVSLEMCGGNTPG